MTRKYAIRLVGTLRSGTNLITDIKELRSLFSNPLDGTNTMGLLNAKNIIQAVYSHKEILVILSVEQFAAMSYNLYVRSVPPGGWHLGERFIHTLAPHQATFDVSDYEG